VVRLFPDHTSEWGDRLSLVVWHGVAWDHTGFMYVGEMLKEWRTNNEEATLERLLSEASIEHLLWEAERANQELILLYDHLLHNTVHKTQVAYALVHSLTQKPLV
jgi:hypothetical protein